MMNDHDSLKIMVTNDDDDIIEILCTSYVVIRRPLHEGGARLGGLILRFGSGFPRPCAEVFFMLSEGAVRGFRKWFFVFQGHVPRCFLCCRKARFEAFGSGFSRPCVSR